MWWGKFRALNITKERKELRHVCESLNVNEEYVSALRTQSYIDFFEKAQSIVNESSSSWTSSSFPSFCNKKFSEFLLEPNQEAIPAILESTPSTAFSKIPELKTLIFNYFELSAEASRICSHLLKNISQIQSNYQYVQRVLETSTDDHYSPEKVKHIVSELNSFVFQGNPFSSPNKQEFELINNKHAVVLNLLKSKRKKIARKIKIITGIHKASGVCITAACGLVTVSAIILAAHSLTALAFGPAIFGLPLKRLKKKLLTLGVLKNGSYLMKGCKQLDVAAKGTYILNRDFDMMGRLVDRLHDEVEHNKEMIKFCLDRREDKSFVQVMKELKKGEVGFRKQIEELEEHVYLCLLTINRARGLVIREVTSISSININSFR